jgi:hypothetical protein
MGFPILIFASATPSPTNPNPTFPVQTDTQILVPNLPLHFTPSLNYMFCSYLNNS